MTTSHEARIEAAARATIAQEQDCWDIPAADWDVVSLKLHGFWAQAEAAITAYLAGDVVVPREATAAMLEAGQKAWLSDEMRRSSTLYRAMVSAATETGG